MSSRESRKCFVSVAGIRCGRSNRAWRQDTEKIFALKLSFDSCLIYNRPYLPNLVSPKLIEYIFSKGNSFPVYKESKELALWRTIEFEPASYIRRIGDQQLNVEIKVRNFTKIFFQHFAIT